METITETGNAPMIELTGISRLYRAQDVETTALRDITLTIERGEFLAIMGPSGSGKSTLLNILGLIDRPSGGSCRFEGRELTGLVEHHLSRYRARHLGFVFQSFNLIDDLTIAENIEMALLYRQDAISPRAGSRRTLVMEAMDKVGIAHRARHYPHQLSGGQQQRAAIARAIVGSPSLILADEPTGNLDSDNGAQVMGILKGLHAGGATIIMVTHARSQADQASRQISMRDGRLLLSVQAVG